MQYDLEEKKMHGTSDFPFEGYEVFTDRENFIVPYHWHAQTEIIFVEHGDVILMVDGNTYVGETDDIFFINPGQLHQLVLDKSDSRYFSFVFSAGWLDFKEIDYIQKATLDPLKKNFGFPFHITPKYSCYESLKNEMFSIHQIYKTAPDSYRLMIKILLYKIILILEVNKLFVPTASYKLANQSHSAIRVKELMDFVAENYSGKITLEQAADIMHMSPKYFSSFFSKTFAMSFTQYVNNYRIDQACILLKTTNTPIMTIGFDVGFDNFSYFIRKFKEIKGYTPKEYRDRITPVT